MATSVQRQVRRAAAVEVAGMTRVFGDRRVIDGLDLRVEAGEFVALIGASGCGKSTLLRVLAGLDAEAGGEVRVARRRAIAFQAPRLLPWKRVWRNVLLGLPGRPDRDRAVAALTEVGLAHHADSWPKVLSGGEAQRASLARALVREPELLLLDEPFGALDALTRLRAQRLVSKLWRRHAPAVALVTHDVQEALLLADRILLMRDGVIAHQVAVDVPRPRGEAHPRLLSLRAHLLEQLGVPAEEAPARPALDADHEAVAASA